MFKSIQGCRALAALLVVLHHLGGALASPKYFGVAAFALPFVAGDAGVEFFFVLSGFVITWAHFDELGRPSNLPLYLRKRVVRIYPTYWIVFAIVYVVAQSSSTLRSHVPNDYLTVLKSLSLVPQESALVGGSGAPVLIVAWTLQYEICFYALMAIFILNRSIGSVACIALLVNFGICHVGVCAFPGHFLSDNLIFLFGIGGLIAYCIKHSIYVKYPAVVATIAAVAFLSFGVFEAVAGTETISIDRRMIYGLLSGFLIMSLVQLENGGRLQIQNRWLPLLGNASYALYLIHFPLISALCKLMIFIGLTGVAGAAVAAPAILTICVVASIGFHLWVERPVLHALSIRSSKTPRHPVSAQTPR